MSASKVKSFNTLYFFLALLIFISCDEEKKETTVFNEPIQNEISYINLPIMIDISQLEDIINETLKGNLIKHSLNLNQKNIESFHLDVRKEGNIRFDMVNNDLFAKIPIKIIATGKATTKLLGKKISKDFSFHMGAIMHTVSDVTTNENWQLITKSSLKKLEWTDKPELDLGFIKIKLTHKVEKALTEKQGELFAKLDKSIKDNLNLVDMVGNIWNKMQKPIRINKNVEDIFLKIEPRGLALHSISGKKRHIILNTHLDAYLKVDFLNDFSNTKLVPLPKLGTVEAFDESFNLNLFADISYAELNQLLDEKMKGKEITVQDFLLKIEKAEVFGKRNKLGVKVNVRGDFEGDLFFTGRPGYHAQSKAFYIDKFDFDMENEDLVLNIASWAYKEEVKELIEAMMFFPVGTHFMRLPLIITDAISHGKIGEKIQLEIPDMIISPKEINIQENSLQILVNSTGTAELKVKSLDGKAT